MIFVENVLRLIVSFLGWLLLLQSPLSASCIGVFAKHDFNSKVVVITGGSRGIGRALVKAFTDAGATTIFTYRSSDEAAQEIVARLGPKVEAHRVDGCGSNKQLH